MSFCWELLLSVVLSRQQERIGKEREEVERQRKLLSKRKPPVATAAASKQPKATKDGDVFLKPADKPLVEVLFDVNWFDDFFKFIKHLFLVCDF